MRVPFPIKVFISYVAVVAAGALPTYFYLQRTFNSELSNAFTVDATSRARLLAVTLEEVPEEERPKRLEDLSGLFIERVTYIRSTGQVSFDSFVTSLALLGDHSDRSEFRQAMGLQGPSKSEEGEASGLGIARRRSNSTQLNTLYVAARVGSEPGAGVVRLAVPVTRIDNLTGRVVAAFRNSVAFSISVAILLSMFAAMVFARPLHRLASRARAIAAGEDPYKHPRVTSADELGDVSKALDSLQEELSDRVAVAEAALSSVEQLVLASPVPMILLDGDDHALAANPLARERLPEDSPTVQELAVHLSESVRFSSKRDRARESFSPQRLDCILGEVELHAVPQPKGQPLTLLVLRGQGIHRSGVRRRRALPKAQDVLVRNASELLSAVWEGGLKGPDVGLVEADNRVVVALRALRDAMPDATLDFTLADTHLILTLDGPSPEPAARVPDLLLRPIGGEVVRSASHVTVKLSRA